MATPIPKALGSMVGFHFVADHIMVEFPKDELLLQSPSFQVPIGVYRASGLES